MWQLAHNTAPMLANTKRPAKISGVTENGKQTSRKRRTRNDQRSQSFAA
jgi:hypothetical protein